MGLRFERVDIAPLVQAGIERMARERVENAEECAAEEVYRTHADRWYPYVLACVYGGVALYVDNGELKAEGDERLWSEYVPVFAEHYKAIVEYLSGGLT